MQLLEINFREADISTLGRELRIGNRDLNFINSKDLKLPCSITLLCLLFIFILLSIIQTIIMFLMNMSE